MLAALALAGVIAAAASVAGRPAGGARIAGTSPIDGRHLSLADYAGRPVAISVWASWCTDCNREAHALVSFARAHPGVQVLGLDLSDTTGGARAFYRRWHVPYPSIADPQGSLSSTLDVTGVPTTLFLNARHRVVDRLIGPASPAGLASGLRAMEARARR